MSGEETPDGIGDGIHRHLTRAEYESIDAMNWSVLKEYSRSPAHARVRYLHPPPPTPALELGQVLHLCILEPHRFLKEVVASPKFDRRTTKGKLGWAEFEEEHAGKTMISEDDFEVCQRVTESMYLHPICQPLLTGRGMNEVTVVWSWEDDDFTIRVKNRLDRVTEWDGWTWVLDFKSARDASRFAFGKQFANLQYHGQSAIYYDGLEDILPSNDARRYMVVAFEKEPPWAIAPYEIDPPILDLGRGKYRRYLRTHAKCQAADAWPAYPNELTQIHMPKWALTEG